MKQQKEGKENGCSGWREEKETEGEGVEKERSAYWAATTFLTPSHPTTNSMLVVCQRNDLTS